ncbi:hypothetical protein HPB47_003722 [Ixodes persulcatus]|uniref:Uncharacterized protein n=1 Tax=Ixodes persulcatus TaxID=34615 RepID=A0AC60PJ24_IXOPE|nr:hypothetical protein HPB47_003722 [Ixodes persulcatus]
MIMVVASNQAGLCTTKYALYALASQHEPNHGREPYWPPTPGVGPPRFRASTPGNTGSVDAPVPRGRASWKGSPPASACKRSASDGAPGRPSLLRTKASVLAMRKHLPCQRLDHLTPPGLEAIFVEATEPLPGDVQAAALSRRPQSLPSVAQATALSRRPRLLADRARPPGDRGGRG